MSITHSLCAAASTDKHVCYPLTDTNIDALSLAQEKESTAAIERFCVRWNRIASEVEWE